jgi:hypothetical protein
VGMLLASVAMLKGKLVTGGIGIFIPVVALVGAIRLAKPHSPWARVSYARRPATMTRARKRFGPAYAARINRIKDLLGGSPSRSAP